MPPPAEGFAARLVIGPVLRAQPDRRLVTLVREGYESAFEEIVRRYGRPLHRYAAAIVGSRAEDVTQDAFSKALLAMRRDGNEIELRPWLFRIVRNTALNELRDSPPSAEAPAEALVGGGRSAAEELERREELSELMRRLRALPEPQRAAIVMRELEGLSHEEIAAALGLSGGGARQAIYRARQALRDGAALLLPLPLLKMLMDHGGEAAAAGAAGGGAAAAGGALGGAGAGMAVKAGVVTAVLAGSVGTGIALQERDRGAGESGSARAAAPAAGPVGATAQSALAASGVDDSGRDDSGEDTDEDGKRHGSGEGDGDRSSRRQGRSIETPGEDDRGQGGPGRGPSRHSHEPAEGGDSNRGPGHGARSESGGGPGPGYGGRHGGGEPEGAGGSGHGGPGPSSGSGSAGSGRDGSRDSPEDRLPPPPPTEEGTHGGDGGTSGPGSGDSGSGSGEDDSGSGSDSSGRGGGEELP